MKNWMWVLLPLLLSAGMYAQQTAAQDAAVRKYAVGKQNLYSESCPYYIAVPLTATSSPVAVIRSVDAQVFIIENPGKPAFEAMTAQFRLYPAGNTWKYSPQLERNAGAHARAAGRYVISGRDAGILAAAVRRVAGLSIIAMDHPSASIIIHCSATCLMETVAGLPEVIFIDLYTEARTEAPVIGYNRGFHGINRLDFAVTGANGKNIVAGVKEQRMDTTDLDLHQRVLPSPLASGQAEPHATAMGTLIGGAGNSFYDGRGLASACRLFSSSFNNLFADNAAVLDQYRVSVQNHSYGTLPQQFYGAEALSYDAHTWQNKQFVHVFSAGNRGTEAAAEGKYIGLTGFANLTGNFKMAKNVVTVGAVDDAGNIISVSSAGPAYDGRLAPQLTALGPNGTSDAAAIVSGTVAVMQQVFRDSNSQSLPPAALIKAVLYNTAGDIGAAGIDYKTGYGLLNSFDAVTALREKKYFTAALSPGQQWTQTITVPPQAARLKLTLAWTDTMAAVNNNRALVNDLDIEVTELNTGTVYRPWVLSVFPNADSLARVPLRKRDSLNTAEQVSIELPAAGDYRVTVTATQTVTPLLPFWLASAIDTLNTFEFTSPQHSSDINRQENEFFTVRWKAAVADANEPGDLFISYNRGAQWQLIAQGVKIARQQYRWQVKDTASTVQFKMETAFGNFLSKECIAGPVVRPQVDFLCADSFQLSWTKHAYASGYRIYTLTDSAYLKPIVIVTDTFRLFRRSVSPGLVYAVEPLLTNQIPAARSVALNIELQGVRCFYRALNYTLQNGNIVDLNLELSFAGYADSIYFERVTAAGVLLEVYNGQRVQSGNLFYTQSVSGLSAGISWFRARLKLRNGTVVYTEIIEVLTSGTRQIVFYPNPAAPGQPLRYVLRQGLPFDSRLLILDMSGRVIKHYSALPGWLDIKGYPAGLYIYRLLTNDGKTIETGRLVITH